MANNNVSLGDRFAEVTVIIVTVAALLAGWAFRSNVENRSVAFEADGITAQAPQGWLQASPVGDEILHTTDISSSGFGATYVLRKVPITANTAASEVSSLLTLDHGQKFTAFRVLDQREVTIYGRTAYELSYVFVESNPDLTHNDLPSVVHGVDYIFINGDTAIVASFWADQDNYDLDLGRFQRFVESIGY